MTSLSQKFTRSDNEIEHWVVAKHGEEIQKLKVQTASFEAQVPELERVIKQQAEKISTLESRLGELSAKVDKEVKDEKTAKKVRSCCWR